MGSLRAKQIWIGEIREARVFERWLWREWSEAFAQREEGSEETEELYLEMIVIYNW